MCDTTIFRFDPITSDTKANIPYQQYINTFRCVPVIMKSNTFKISICDYEKNIFYIQI